MVIRVSTGSVHHSIPASVVVPRDIPLIVPARLGIRIPRFLVRFVGRDLRLVLRLGGIGLLQVAVGCYPVLRLFDAGVRLLVECYRVHVRDS